MSIKIQLNTDVEILGSAPLEGQRLEEFLYLGHPAPASGASPEARFLTRALDFPNVFLALRTPDGYSRLGATRSLDQGRAVAVGFFASSCQGEARQKAFAELVRVAEAWAKEQGAQRIVGPMMMTTWFPYRARMWQEDHSAIGETPRFSWEPQQNPGDESFWSEAGFEVLETYHTKGLGDLAGFAKKLRASRDKAEAKGYRPQAFSALVTDPQSRGELMRGLYELSMESFDEAFLFTPIPYAAFEALYVTGLSALKGGSESLQHAYLLKSAEGEPAAFSFAFVDQGYVVIKTLAVAAKFRGQGLSNAVMSYSCESALAAGVDRMIHALVRRGNISETYAGKAEELWEHRYALFAKSL
ncbi:MAG TPA: GNAT family N-acetyltransferase [Pseudobdellovibrionaceae bacterium]|nr:GNAT family N-acetyltransferase [Pseudobdellovibrionaceae bacterium]